MRKLFGLTALAGLCSASLCLAQTTPDPRPNILFIVADDLGFTDIGAFGGEIPTPNLDSLAYRGVRMTNLHTAPACQPSRVMLMSSNGVSEALETRPPLETGERDNQISLDYAILPELMQDAGYETYMAGKWDIGFREGYLPSDRGFDRSFVQPARRPATSPKLFGAIQTSISLMGCRYPTRICRTISIRRTSTPTR